MHRSDDIQSNLDKFILSDKMFGVVITLSATVQRTNVMLVIFELYQVSVEKKSFWFKWLVDIMMRETLYVCVRIVVIVLLNHLLMDVWYRDKLFSFDVKHCSKEKFVLLMPLKCIDFLLTFFV